MESNVNDRCYIKYYDKFKYEIFGLQPNEHTVDILKNAFIDLHIKLYEEYKQKIIKIIKIYKNLCDSHKLKEEKLGGRFYNNLFNLYCKRFPIYYIEYVMQKSAKFRSLSSSTLLTNINDLLRSDSLFDFETERAKTIENFYEGFGFIGENIQFFTLDIQFDKWFFDVYKKISNNEINAEFDPWFGILSNSYSRPIKDDGLRYTNVILEIKRLKYEKRKIEDLIDEKRNKFCELIQRKADFY